MTCDDRPGDAVEVPAFSRPCGVDLALKLLILLAKLRTLRDDFSRVSETTTSAVAWTAPSHRQCVSMNHLHEFEVRQCPLHSKIGRAAPTAPHAEFARYIRSLDTHQCSPSCYQLNQVADPLPIPLSACLPTEPTSARRTTGRISATILDSMPSCSKPRGAWPGPPQQLPPMSLVL